MRLDVQFKENENKFDVGNFVNMQPINMKFWEATVVHATYIDDLLQRNVIIINCGTSTTVI